MKSKSIKAVKSIKERIQDYFFENPTSRLRVRQIEKTLKLPLPSVIRYSKELEKEGILKKTDISGVKFYSADRSSKNFLIEKKQHNLKKLFETDLVEHLIKKYNNPTMSVFGSFARGEDIENSDIDLYVETQKKETFDLNDFENKLNRKIQVFNHRDIREIKNKELANNIINGNVLNGFLEVLK